MISVVPTLPTLVVVEDDEDDAFGGDDDGGNRDGEDGANLGSTPLPIRYLLFSLLLLMLRFSIIMLSSIILGYESLIILGILEP